ncbi:putative Golgi apparatus protein [Chloropicon primus]|nr:putative Golgi apparatus protein [Chloropicon primus]
MRAPRSRNKHTVVVLSSFLVGVLLLSTTVVGLARAEGDSVATTTSSDSDFKEDLADAIEQQEFREDVDKEVISHIVDVAPEVELTNGDGDVSTTQNCTVDIDVFCSDVTPGKGRLAKCLQEQVNEEKMGNAEGRSVSQSCKFELKTFQYLRATNINLNVPYAEACKDDVEEHCEDITEDDGEDATILIQNCLRKKKYQISQKCRTELTTVLLGQAKDFKMNVELFYSCNDDVERHCKDASGDGGVQDCLMKKRRKLEWECEEALLRNIEDNSDDLRLLSYKIYKTCLPDKKKFCKEIELGNARTQACLESQMNEPGFSQACRKELLYLQEQRTTQWQWDTQLKNGCKKEIPELCGYSDDEMFYGDEDNDVNEDEISLDDSTVVNCLVDYRDEITNEECKAQVEKKIVGGSKNIRLNRRAFEACFDDQNKYCRDVKPGEGLVYECLRKSGGNLAEECKKELFEEAKLESENVDRNPQIMKKCKRLMKSKCKDVSQGEGRVLDCLTKNMNAPQNTQACKQELHNYLVLHMKDYRLDYGLSHACKGDVAKFCEGDNIQCQADSELACQGEVYNCLIGNLTSLTNQCKAQVKEAVATHALNVRYDPQLLDDCRDDITNFCLLEFGSSANEQYAVHDCLFQNIGQLSKRCKRQEYKLESAKLRDVELMPHIMKDCPTELASYCRDVPHGSGQKWSCLSHYAMSKPYSPDCLKSMYLHTKRISQSKGIEPEVAAGCKHELKDCRKHVGGDRDGYFTPMKCLVFGSSDDPSVKNFTKTGALCQKQVAKYTRQGFYFFFGGSKLLEVCDADVATHCGEYKESPEMDDGGEDLAGEDASSSFEYAPGSVLSCLAKAGADNLSDDCRQLVRVGLLGDTLNKDPTAPIKMKEGGGKNEAGRDEGESRRDEDRGQATRSGGETAPAGGIVIRGGLAVISIGCFVLVILGVAFFIYRHYYGGGVGMVGRGGRNPYTLVMKQGDV